MENKIEEIEEIKNDNELNIESNMKTHKKKYKALKITLAILSLAIIILAIVYMIPVMTKLSTPQGKIEFKDNAVSETIKEYFIAQIRYSFVFPFFLNYDKKTIILSCINLLLKQLFPNYIITLWDNKEYINFKSDIIQCSKLFEQFLNEKKENNDNKNDKEINIGIIRKINSTNTNSV